MNTKYMHFACYGLYFSQNPEAGRQKLNQCVSLSVLLFAVSQQEDGFHVPV